MAYTGHLNSDTAQVTNTWVLDFTAMVSIISFGLCVFEYSIWIIPEINNTLYTFWEDFPLANLVWSELHVSRGKANATHGHCPTRSSYPPAPFSQIVFWGGQCSHSTRPQLQPVVCMGARQARPEGCWAPTTGMVLYGQPLAALRAGGRLCMALWYTDGWRMSSPSGSDRSNAVAIQVAQGSWAQTCQQTACQLWLSHPCVSHLAQLSRDNLAI